MLSRLRSTWLAGGGAMLLVLSLSGIAAGAALVADTAETVEPAEPADTTWTFEDIDGNGVDDDCQDVVAAANETAVAAALTEADLDGDGTISVSEAAQSDWTGGPNCNHGGYVSTVAQGDDCDDADVPEGTTDESTEEGDGATDESTEEAVAACDEETDEAAPTEEEADQSACEAPVEAPVEEPAAEEETPVDTAPNAHGKAVSEVAKSPAVGGKNCNHGGAVSEAAKKDHGDSHGNDAKKAAGKAHGKGKGHSQD